MARDIHIALAEILARPLEGVMIVCNDSLPDAEYYRDANPAKHGMLHVSRRLFDRIVIALREKQNGAMLLDPPHRVKSENFALPKKLPKKPVRKIQL